MEHKYRLQKYGGRNSRLTCPQCGKPFCFTLYVDAGGNIIAPTVGRCDHQTSCGYHLTPKQYFEQNPQERERYTPNKPYNAAKPAKTDYIPFDLVRRSESSDNSLMRYLRQLFSPDEVERVTRMYHLGSTKKGEIIFPQIDGLGNCRTGKVMDYDKDGHRIKGEVDKIDWLHSRWMRMQGKQNSDFNLKQCLFGEHLLTKQENREKFVCIVESEKSAVICAMQYPDYVWVSCGGKQGLTSDRCKVLANRNLMVYADADATEKWREKMKSLTFCKRIRLSDWAKDEAPDSKRDIADVVLQERQQAAQEAEPQTVGDLIKLMVEVGYTDKEIQEIVHI